MWVQAEQYKIGASLAAARRQGCHPAELAARLGKPQSFVSEYERGQRRGDLELLVISRALGLDPLDLFVEIARPDSQPI